VIEGGFIERMVQMVYNDSLEVQRECVWALSNTTACKNTDLIQILVDKDIIPALCSWLDKQDSKTLVIILEGIRNILQTGQSINGTNYPQKIEECGGLDKIENL
jgi:Armadillo/beta-catenin-like repeat